MAVICPKCKKSTVEYDARIQLFKCFSTSCSWTADNKNIPKGEYFPSEYSKNLANGCKPAPSI